MNVLLPILLYSWATLLALGILINKGWTPSTQVLLFWIIVGGPICWVAFLLWWIRSRVEL
jgi:hypothetical protein